MRSIWKGAISFGLVTIPIGLYSATENKTPKLKMLRQSDGSPIKYKRVAESDGQEVAWGEIVKGLEVEKGRYVVFTDDELESAANSSRAKVIDVVQFVDEHEIDPILFRSSYYLAPEQSGLKAYRLLYDSLKESQKVAIAKAALRDKVYPATIRPLNNILVLETMHWPDEIREPEFEGLDQEIEVRPEEIQMARMIIDNLSEPFDPEIWKDESRGAIEELARKKVEGEEIIAPSAPEPTKVIDLLDALKASVDATKAKRAAS